MTAMVSRVLELSLFVGLLAGCPVEYVVPVAQDTQAESSTDTESSDTDESETEADSGTGGGDCMAPMLVCGGTCIDPSMDSEHCGECGEDCGPGGTCVNGDCVDACGDTCDRHREVCLNGTCVCRLSFTRCGDVCVDLQSNPAYCGECTESCLDEDGEAGEVHLCEAGDCFDEGGCSTGLTQCGQSCVDLQTHPLHCDECGRACDGDEVCINGECEDL